MRKLPVVPICRMRAALSKDPNQQHICAVPPLQGALRDRHERRKRDAMDASGVARRAIFLASAKPRGSDVPRPTSSLWNHPQATETTKPGLREERGINRPTIAQRVPDRFGEPVVTYSCATLHRTRAAGASGTRHSPAPFLLRGTSLLHHSGAIRRGNAEAYPPGCLKFESAALWSSSPLDLVMAGLVPAMTIESAYPAPTAFFRQARCSAQVQPGGCEARSADARSLAGAAVGATVGIASFKARASAD